MKLDKTFIAVMMILAGGGGYAAKANSDLADIRRDVTEIRERVARLEERTTPRHIASNP